MYSFEFIALPVLVLVMLMEFFFLCCWQRFALPLRRVGLWWWWYCCYFVTPARNPVSFPPLLCLTCNPMKLFMNPLLYNFPYKNQSNFITTKNFSAHLFRTFTIAFSEQHVLITDGHYPPQPSQSLSRRLKVFHI